MDITKTELDCYIKTTVAKVETKIEGTLTAVIEEVDFKSYGIAIESHTINNHWGRFGAEIAFSYKNENAYGQWMFLGIYYDTRDHGFPFKRGAIPELAFFLDIAQDKRNKLKSIKGIEACFIQLRKKGFDDNLFENITTNHYRMLAKRRSLTELDGFTMKTVKSFVDTVLGEICEQKILARAMFSS